MWQLDCDISRMLEEDMDLHDHNSDKKQLGGSADLVNNQTVTILDTASHGEVHICGGRKSEAADDEHVLPVPAVVSNDAVSSNSAEPANIVGSCFDEHTCSTKAWYSHDLRLLSATPKLSQSIMDIDSAKVPQTDDVDIHHSAHNLCPTSACATNLAVPFPSNQLNSFGQHVAGVKDETPHTTGSQQSVSTSYLHDYQAVRVAGLQLSAMKSLASILSCGRFMELLLTPQMRPACMDRTSSGNPVSQADDYLKVTVRGIVRRLVGRSTLSSPPRHPVSLTDLERLFTVLHSDVIESVPDDPVSQPAYNGKHFSYNRALDIV